MDLKFLDPRITEKLLEGHEDTITEAAQAREKFYRDQRCPTCFGESLRKHTDLRTLFRPDDPLPRYQLICNGCGCHFDPHSGIILKTGNLAEGLRPAFHIFDKGD